MKKMMMLPLGIGLLTVVILTGMGLSGCVRALAPATQFYVLNPLHPSAGIVDATAFGKGISVEVSSLRLPRYLEKPQIVTRSTENRLELSERSRWGGNLQKDMMRVLARNLSILLATPDVAIAPPRMEATPDFRVDLEVLQFERDAGGQVRISVMWRLSDGGNRNLLATRSTDLASPAVESGQKNLEPTVAAMSTLLGELSRIIAREIFDQAGKRSGG